MLIGVTCYAVEAIRKECRHVEMNLVPKPVISLFQSSMQSSKQRHSTNSICVKVDGVEGGRGGYGNAGECCDLDWTKIDTVLMSTLMEFQKEGVK